MTVGAVLTLGLGSFGSVNLLPTLGYKSGTAPVPTPAKGGAGGLITFLAHRGIDWAEVEKKRLEIQLARKEAELKRVKKKIKLVERKAEKSEHPQGVLANIGTMYAKQSKLINEIETIEVNLDAVLQFLGSLDFDDDDLDDWITFV